MRERTETLVDPLPLVDLAQFNKNLINELSQREFDVVNLVVKGMSNAEIAEILGIKLETVKEYIKRIKPKIPNDSSMDTRIVIIQYYFERVWSTTNSKKPIMSRTTKSLESLLQQPNLFKFEDFNKWNKCNSQKELDEDEFRTIQLISQGKTNEEIAIIRHRSVATIKDCITNIRAKLPPKYTIKDDDTKPILNLDRGFRNRLAIIYSKWIIDTYNNSDSVV